MINNENIQQEIDKTLESLDGLNRATANPFLFTRIKARMQKQSGWEKTTSFISRPVFALAILVAVIAINTWAVFGSNDQTINSERQGIAITDIADEYNLVANNNYHYENIPGE
jgi:hypothetical protein